MESGGASGIWEAPYPVCRPARSACATLRIRISPWFQAVLRCAFVAVALFLSSVPIQGEAPPPASRNADLTAKAALQTELAKAQAALKSAREERSQVYEKARRLFKTCPRELRPFCRLSAQTMRRQADARYRYRADQELRDIAARDAGAVVRQAGPGTPADADATMRPPRKPDAGLNLPVGGANH